MQRNLMLITVLSILLILSCSEETTAPELILPTATAPAEGDGSVFNPYLIETLEHLYWLSQNEDRWDMHYKQVSDIDASETKNWACGGMEPIGYSYDYAFSGFYDGDGYVIEDLYIDRARREHVGLFGFTNGAAISNVRLTGVTVNGYGFVGGLVGRNTWDSVISNSFVEGEVSGKYSVGGIVGYSIGSAVDSCYAGGNISGDDFVGGLVGTNTGSTIDASSSNANVSGKDGVGGLVGRNVSNSIISNSYSRGAVTRSTSVVSLNIGIFAGRNVSSAIEYSYSTGNVTYQEAENPQDKGFVGDSIDGTFNANFFDSEASAQTSGIGAEAKTTAEMQIESTFTDAGWDFDEIWTIDGVTNDGYPYLLWER